MELLSYKGATNELHGMLVYTNIVVCLTNHGLKCAHGAHLVSKYSRDGGESINWALFIFGFQF